MRGTSAQSLHEVVRDAESRFAAEHGSLESTAQELFSVVDVIDGSNQLVRLLSDAGRDPGLKESAARALFGSRIGPLCEQIVLDAVRHRWSEQDDLLDGLEDVGVVALLEQASREDVLGAVEEELFQFSRAIQGSPALSEAFDEAREDPRRRRDIVRRLLEGRAHRLTVALAEQAVGRASDEKPARRVLRFAEFASERRQRLLAVVSSARPLSAAQQERLGAVLSRIYGRSLQMNTEISPDVVGGLRIQVGDDLFDATVLARLAQARHSLAS